MKRKNSRKEAGVLLVGALLIWSSVAALATTSDGISQNMIYLNIVTKKSNITPMNSGNILWNNGVENWSSAFAAQWDESSNFDAYPADDFIFDEDTDVYRVYWGGGYWNCNPVDGPKDYHYDWNITFFEDDGSGYHPGDVYAGPFTISDNEIIKSTPVINSTTISNGIWGCGYYVWLPEKTTFNAATKYWISIYALGEIFPQSGWAAHNESLAGILLHEANFKSDHFGYPNWMNTSVVFGEPYDMLYALLDANPDFEITISKGIGVSATIKNMGLLDATNVTVTIATTGRFVLFGGSKTISIGDLALGDTGKAKSIMLGIGKIGIEVQVTSDQGMTADKNTDGFLLLFLIK